jgi:hypothetical protein
MCVEATGFLFNEARGSHSLSLDTTSDMRTKIVSLH